VIASEVIALAVTSVIALGGDSTSGDRRVVMATPDNDVWLFTSLLAWNHVQRVEHF
jgi:hypothetical protein